MQPAKASAPGKLMLLGEHAVVYGHSCLVTAVDIRYSASVTPLEESPPALKIHRGRSSVTRVVPLTDLGQRLDPGTAFVEAVANRIQQHHPIPASLHIETDGPPISYGLGSSSAITAATAAALNESLALGLSNRELFDLCLEAVLDVQGKASGFDVASAIYGRTIYFSSWGQIITPLNVPSLPIVIAYSGAKVGTVSLVEKVAELFSRQHSGVSGIFDVMFQLTENGERALEDQEWADLGDLFNIQQGLLDALGVSSPQLARLIEAARSAGALGAKLSGAGGGDCMIALASPDTTDPVRRAITDAGGLLIDYAANTPGVRIKPSATKESP
jgi:mevalonate kinase